MTLAIKTCTRCQIAKPLEAFYLRKDRDKPTSACRECLSTALRLRREPIQPRECAQCAIVFTPKARRDTRFCGVRCQSTARRRAHGQKPKQPTIVDGCKRCNRCGEWLPLAQFGRRRSRNNKVLTECRSCSAARSLEYSTSQRGRDRRYLRQYGVTAEWWNETFAKQKGGCALCVEPPTGRHPLHVDHDHSSGKVRGLLCHYCNMALGLFKDDPIVLRRAAEYLVRE